MRIRIVLLTLVLIGLAALTWIVMRAPYPPAGWVSMEAPNDASVNQSLPLRVTLTPEAPAGTLVVTLHGFGRRREPLGFISSATSTHTNAQGGVFSVEIPVPDQLGLKQVQVILYLGPTANWSDRQVAAKTVEIPVIRRTAEQSPIHLKPLFTFEAKSDPELYPEEIPWVRTLSGLLWVAAALLAGRRLGSPLPGTSSSRTRCWRSGVVLACLAAALVEWSRIHLLLANGVRTFAIGHHLYWDRRWLQQGATLLALVGSATATLLALMRLKSLRRGILVFSLVGFATLSLAEAFSLHEIDRLLAWKIGPLPLIQIAKFATVLTAMVVLIMPAEPHLPPA